MLDEYMNFFWKNKLYVLASLLLIIGLRNFQYLSGVGFPMGLVIGMWYIKNPQKSLWRYFFYFAGIISGVAILIALLASIARLDWAEIILLSGGVALASFTTLKEEIPSWF